MAEDKEFNQELRDFPGNKFYRVYFNRRTPPDLSEKSIELHSITGCYADEYIPTPNSVDNIFSVICDESTFKSHVCVSVVVMRFETARRKFDECESSLESLCAEYQLKTIHFADIFGQRILGDRQDSFLQRYAEIIGNDSLLAAGFSVNKLEFRNSLPFHDVSDSELYSILFWNVMEHLVEKLPVESVFHLYFEQENHLSRSLIQNSIAKLYNGINQCKALRENNSSICRHPLIFSKKALLHSSLSDLAAYSNNVLQQKLDVGVPIAKILRNHERLIKISKTVFNDPISIHQSKHGASELHRLIG